LVALFGVLLVYQIGHPRIWMVMSRDGLLPARFGKLHPKYLVPGFSTILTGCLVGIPSLFMNLTEVTDLSSIGTLCAFLLVSLGIYFMDPHRVRPAQAFRIPYLPAKWWLPPITVMVLGAAIWSNPAGFSVASLNEWDAIRDRVPFFGFLIGLLALNVDCIKKERSLIPALAVAMTGYLKAGISLKEDGRLILSLVEQGAAALLDNSGSAFRCIPTTSTLSSYIRRQENTGKHSGWA
jgi:amino acid transporter